MCNPVSDIFNDLRHDSYQTDIDPDEELEFIDYCAAALCGEVVFFGPDESSAPYCVAEESS